MKALLFLVALGATAALGSATKASKSEDGGRNRIRDSDELSPLANANVGGSPLSGLVEVKEDEIPDGTTVYVMDDMLDASRQKGETLETADSIVFRPLFRYRSKQEALARRRVANGYRRRYFVQSRPYRNAYYYYYPRYRYRYY